MAHTKVPYACKSTPQEYVAKSAISDRNMEIWRWGQVQRNVVLARDYKEVTGVYGFSLKADATYSDSFRCYFSSLRTAVFITPSFRTASKAELYEYSNTSSVPNPDAKSHPCEFM